MFCAPYDENFYNGDWMLGPNIFCFGQTVCAIGSHIDAYALRVKPKNFEDAEKMIEKILTNKNTILQYK